MEYIHSTQKIVSIFAGDDKKQGEIISNRTKKYLGCTKKENCINCNYKCLYFKQEKTKNIINNILNQSYLASLNIMINKL